MATISQSTALRIRGTSTAAMWDMAGTTFPCCAMSQSLCVRRTIGGGGTRVLAVRDGFRWNAGAPDGTRRRPRRRGADDRLVPGVLRPPPPSCSSSTSSSRRPEGRGRRPTTTSPGCCAGGGSGAARWSCSTTAPAGSAATTACRRSRSGRSPGPSRPPRHGRSTAPSPGRRRGRALEAPLARAGPRRVAAADLRLPRRRPSHRPRWPPPGVRRARPRADHDRRRGRRTGPSAALGREQPHRVDPGGVRAERPTAAATSGRELVEAAAAAGRTRAGAITGAARHANVRSAAVKRSPTEVAPAVGQARGDRVEGVIDARPSVATVSPPTRARA